MSDLVERLRRRFTFHDTEGKPGLVQDCRDAADEITRLTTALAEARTELEAVRLAWQQLNAENKTLLAENIALRDEQREREEWVLVPREPTEDMIDVACRWFFAYQHKRDTDKRGAISEAYKAMLSAAPAVPEDESVDAWAERMGKSLAERDGTDAVAYAPILEPLRKALERIRALDPTIDSGEGFNEWGEADCFHQAQEIAEAALKSPAEGEGT